MDIFWQHIIILAAVSLAVVYLAFHYVRRKRNKATCANCPTFKTFQNQHKAKTK